jgi:hypothetical protein
LTWTPTVYQAPSTNVVKLQVTDQGFPPRSTTASFTTVVGLLPAIDRVAPNVTGEGLNVIFHGVRGKSYALAYKNSLEETQWLRLPGAIFATSDVSSIPLPAGTNAQRFFRIEVTN